MKVEVLYNVRPHWKQFGVALGVNYEVIQSIECKPRHSVREKMISMLHEYSRLMRGKGKTWKDIEDALRNIEDNSLADHFKALPQGEGECVSLVINFGAENKSELISCTISFIQFLLMRKITLT